MGDGDRVGDREAKAGATPPAGAVGAPEALEGADRGRGRVVSPKPALSRRGCRTGRSRPSPSSWVACSSAFPRDEMTPANLLRRLSLLALCPCQVAFRSRLFELDTQFGRFVLRRRHSAARLGGCGVCLGDGLLGCSDVAFSLGDILVRDDENPIACVDALDLCSDGCSSFSPVPPPVPQRPASRPSDPRNPSGPHGPDARPIAARTATP